MQIPWLESPLIAILLMGIVVAVLGLLALLDPAARWTRWGTAVAAVGLAVASTAATATGQPRGLWLPPTLLSGLCGAFLFLSSPRLARTAAALLCGPRLYAAALVAAGPVLAAGCVWWASLADPDWTPSPALRLAHGPDRLEPVQSYRAVTDRGRPLPLYHPADAPPTATELWEMDAEVIAARRLEAELIRTAAPSSEYNCHGWVFTGGVAWVRGEDVDAILQDNAYYAVDAPRSDDVVVYRDAAGRVTHSGIVQNVTRAGLVLVESKWGRGGRFLHAPATAAYGAPTFYRSSRLGHRLRGLDAEEADRRPAVLEE